jgi:hypothetical protein
VFYTEQKLEALQTLGKNVQKVAEGYGVVTSISGSSPDMDQQFRFKP